MSIPPRLVDTFASDLQGYIGTAGSPLPVSSTPVDTRPVSGTITARDIASSTATGQDSVSIMTGTPTANSTYSAATNGQISARFQITGTWTGTLQFEVSADSGTTWVSSTFSVIGTGFVRSSVTANGVFLGDISEATNVRVRSIAAMTGTATVVVVYGSNGSIARNIMPTRIIDNSSGNGNTATVKAASTAAAASDTAFVVGLHPTSPLPAGSSLVGSVGVNDGVVTASNFAGDSGYNGQVVGNGIKTISWTMTASSTGVPTGFPFNAANYRWTSTQLTTISASATATFQASNNNSNFVNNLLSASTNTTQVSGATGASTGIFHGAIVGQYFQVNITANTGTISGVTVISSLPVSLTSLGVTAGQSGTWTVQPGNTANTTPWLASINAGSNTATVTTRNSLLMEGPTASGSTVAAAPVTVGARAATTLPTAVADTQVVNGMADKFGRTINVTQAPRELIGTQATTITSSTSPTTIVTAGAAGVFNDLTFLSVTNISATGTEVTISDGTVSFAWYVPPTDMRGGTLTVPIPATSAATAWTLACVTSVASIKVFAVYVKNK